MYIAVLILLIKLKKTMKKYLLLLLFGFLSFNLVFTSCKKDEEETPPAAIVETRDQSIGDYDGDVFLFLTSDLQTADTTWQQDFSIAENSSNSLSIDFVIDGNIEFTGSKIATATNGFTFDIESQNFVDDGSTYTVTGNNLVELDGTKYHGAYETSSKEIAASFNITIDGTDFVMLFGGVKK
jgi:hypothetical protein